MPKENIKKPNQTETKQEAFVSGTAEHWIVVTQVKSDRVVYFTNDLGYQAPMHGDWYYINQHLGELPLQMTLANCWRWRYRGKDFIDTSEPNITKGAQNLLDLNRAALQQILADKIHALRKPFAAKNITQHTMRAVRLAEAEAIVAGSQGITKLHLLPSAAAARHITIHAMAERTIRAYQLFTQLLVETECQREEFSQAILEASTAEELVGLRDRLMSELAPQTNQAQAIKPSHTTPQAMRAAPTADELAQEQMRLHVELRIKINNLRRQHASDYLLDDVIVKHKGRLAQAVLQNQTQGMDLKPLISHAAASGQTLEQAAHDVLGEMNDTAQALLETEQMKEALSVRIASVRSFDDIEAASKNIQRLKLSPILKNKESTT